MRLWLLIGLWAWGATLGSAQAPVFHSRFIPERPAELVAEWKGTRYPVIAFANNRPIVRADGKKRTCEPKALALQVGRGFAPGFVTMDNTAAQSWEIEQTVDGVSLPTRPGWSKFSADLTADRALEEVYIALVVFEADEQRSEAPPAIAILGVPVGQLKPGEKRRVNATLPALNSQKKVAWAALVFCSEGQVRSSGPGRIISVFFDRVERLTLQRVINERILAGQDAPLQLLRHLAVELEPELHDQFRGQTVQTRLHIGIDGTVEGVRLVEPRDRALERVLEQQLRHWLFVPPMKDGLIVRQQVTLPLQL